MNKLMWRIADYLVPAVGVFGVCVVFGLVTLPSDIGLVMLLGATIYSVFRWLLPVLVGRGQSVGEVQRPATGLMAEGDCTGWIGWIRFRRPALYVSVYQDRFIIETFAAVHTIMDSEIDSVDNSELFQIVIRHHSGLTTSPIRLSLGKNDPIRDAIAAFS